ncbi:MAG: Fe-S cluster assembly scaffold SufA [Pseudomonadota bacterium]
MNALPKFSIVTMTDAARERVREIIANANRDVAGVRVGVKNSGCAGMAYTLDYVEEIDPKDDVVEEDGFKLFVDPKAVLFLLGTEMDYQVSTLSSGFIFNNPNQTSACGCGESVAIKPADPNALASA